MHDKDYAGQKKLECSQCGAEWSQTSRRETWLLLSVARNANVFKELKVVAFEGQPIPAGDYSLLCGGYYCSIESFVRSLSILPGLTPTRRRKGKSTVITKREEALGIAITELIPPHASPSPKKGSKKAEGPESTRQYPLGLRDPDGDPD
jgi:hypothetical protein